MISTRKQWTRLVFLGAIIACLFFSYTTAAPAPSVNDLIGSLSDKITSDPGQLKNLIDNYCGVVLGSSGFENDGFAYNARYSTFIYLLCSNVSSAAPSKLVASSFTRDSFAELGFQDIVSDGEYSTDLCAPGSMNNSCSLAKNMPKLMNDIMNDYINIKQSGLYGDIVSYKSEEDLEKNVINPYFSGYFGIDICDTKRPHPKTCSMVKSYVKSVRNILSEVRIFSTTGILHLTPASSVPCTQVSNPDVDIFYCGLKGTGSSMMSFVNLAYNEIFYYRLFMGYYMTMIQKYPNLLPDYTSYDTISRKFSSQYIWSKSALSLSLRMMRDTYMAFPFHVGFSMYEEDLDGFGKSLARIAPPIYTLGLYKLRNVQKPE